MERRARRWVRWVAAGSAVLVAVAAVGLVVLWKVVFEPDCYDRRLVALLADDPVERVRPEGAVLGGGPLDPICSWIEPRYEEPSRSWWFDVSDTTSAPDAVRELTRSARRHGWRPLPPDPAATTTSTPIAPGAPDGPAVQMTKVVDGYRAVLDISSTVVDGAATDDVPTGTVTIWVETRIPTP